MAASAGAVSPFLQLVESALDMGPEPTKGGGQPPSPRSLLLALESSGASSPDAAAPASGHSLKAACEPVTLDHYTHSAWAFLNPHASSPRVSGSGPSGSWFSIAEAAGGVAAGTGDQSSRRASFSGVTVPVLLTRCAEAAQWTALDYAYAQVQQVRALQQALSQEYHAGVVPAAAAGPVACLGAGTAGAVVGTEATAAAPPARLRPLFEESPVPRHRDVRTQWWSKTGFFSERRNRDSILL